MVFATSMAGLTADLDEVCLSGADEAFKSLDLVDLNVVLFRADEEERDATGECRLLLIRVVQAREKRRGGVCFDATDSFLPRLQTGGDGAYTIPDYGTLVYCGLQGWMAPLISIIRYNVSLRRTTGVDASESTRLTRLSLFPSQDLGAPLCEHLRKGTWALDYVHGRLERFAQLFISLSTGATS